MFNPSAEFIAYCTSEVGRLDTQEFFNAVGEPSIEDLAKSLAEVADDAAHATRMISYWKRNTRTMLHESELERVAGETRIRKPIQPRTCTECNGLGWKRSFALWTRREKQDGLMVIDKQPITEAEFESLSKTVDWETRTVHEFTHKCACPAAA